MHTSVIRTAVRRTALLALFAAPALGAQERSLFTWNGRVDDDIRVVVKTSTIRSELVSGEQLRVGRVSDLTPLPRMEGTVRVERLRGRGDVTVIQQPTASNRFTAVIEVKDTISGADAYQFRAYFTPRETAGNASGPARPLNTGDVVMRWSGNVDKDILLTLRGTRVRQQMLAGAASKGVQSTIAVGGLPRQQHELTLTQREGRGTVTVTQQPSAANNYVALIRVRDPKAGFGYYDFDIVW